MKMTDKLKKQRLYLDGGMGTMLQARGLKAGEPSESFNLTHPEIISQIHREYFLAGSDIASTNTFGVNCLKYDEKTAVRMTFAAIKAAKGAASEFEDKYVALDIGPLGRLLKPYGDLPFEDAVNAFKPIIKCGAEAGADIVLIETMNDSYETKAAVIAAKESCSLPIFVTNVYDETGKLMTGADIPAMVAMLEGLGVDAIGMNCSLGPKQMLEFLPTFIEKSSLPIIITPNAGLPKSANGTPVYDIDAEEFSEIMAEIAKKGANILGGCCGTSPEYIAKTHEKTTSIPFFPPSFKDICAVSSYTHSVEIGKKPIIIGERINPTGKPLLKAALRDKNYGFILKEALTEEECGADILDVNVGLPELDEAEEMVRTISEIQAVCDLPLQIDTVNVAAMKKALRIYNGKPLINSVSGKRESLDNILPLAAKYGGVLIALTLDEKGIPNTAEGRLEIAEKIMNEAAKYGIDKKDIIVDPLAMAISSQKESAKITLDALSLIKNKLGLKTSLGISNISFGLPQRDFITAGFYTLALSRGLDCAIMNPCSKEMMKAYHAYTVLMGMDDNFEEYIVFAEGASSSTSESKAKDDEISLKEAIIKGLKDKAIAAAKEALRDSSPLDVIDLQIIPALNEVGSGFENKTVYLPQLLMSAETAGCAFDIVKSTLPPKTTKGDTIIVATVKGDIHDIGKNIVRTLLENFGFDVIDLGRDVAPEIIVEETKKRKCRLVGLSALMTTTVPAMQETIKQLNEACPETRVVVGGAVLTQEYADMIGADHYSPDAMETVRYAEQIFGRK